MDEQPEDNKLRRKIAEVSGDVIERENLKRAIISADSYKNNANECTTLWLESEPDFFGCKEYVFNPEYTNQIFREEEEIHGYKDLELEIHFLGGSLYSHVIQKYKDKSPDADPILFQIKNALYPSASSDDLIISKDRFLEKLKNEVNFIPPGNKLHEFERKGYPIFNYEIYHCKFSTPGFEDYNDRLQVFLKFFIDGGSYIEHTDFWDYYILFQKNKANGVYTLCGFCTTYTFFLRFNKKRIRISQFLVLPPFQRKGLGTVLLKTAYDRIFADSECFEMTVEDSSMDFQHLRDLLDVKELLTRGFFQWALKYRRQSPTAEEFNKISLTPKEIKGIQEKMKFTKVQIKRVYEMLLLAIADMNDPNMHLQFKTTVRNRLLKANKMNFHPMHKKKYPTIEIDSTSKLFLPTIEEFLKEELSQEEIEDELDRFYEEIFEQYNTILKKIDAILEELK